MKTIKNTEPDTFFARKRQDVYCIDNNRMYEDSIRFYDDLIDEYEDDEDN